MSLDDFLRSELLFEIDLLIEELKNWDGSFKSTRRVCRQMSPRKIR